MTLWDLITLHVKFISMLCRVLRTVAIYGFIRKKKKLYFATASLETMLNEIFPRDILLKIDISNALNEQFINNWLGEMS